VPGADILGTVSREVETITDDNGPAESDTKEHKLPDLIVRRTLIVNEQPRKRREGRSRIA
jgi:hypothetical protein